jgi:hypothetical protein
MTETSARPGVVVDRPDLTILDTRDMPWENTDWFMPGSLRKVLSCDDTGEPVILARWLAARDSAPTTAPSFGFHLAPEYYFCVSGESVQLEWEPDVFEEAITFRDGFWLDRKAGSLHAGGPTTSPTGATWISWMLEDDGALVGAAESLALMDFEPADARPIPIERTAQRSSQGVALDQPLVRIADTRALAWEPHPFFPGVVQKVLSYRADGDATVTFTWIPPGPFPARALPVRLAAPYRELSLVMSGDLRVIVDGAGEVVLRDGFWIDRRPGSVLGFDEGSCSTGGCVLLQFRVGTDGRFIADAEKNERWSRALGTEAKGVVPAATDAERRELIAR